MTKVLLYKAMCLGSPLSELIALPSWELRQAPQARLLRMLFPCSIEANALRHLTQLHFVLDRASPSPRRRFHAGR